MTESPSDRRILVIGSVVREIALMPSRPRPQDSPTPRFTRHVEWVGAPTVDRIIRMALREESPSPTASGQPAPVLRPSPPVDACTELTAVFASYPQGSRANADQTLRVRTSFLVEPQIAGTIDPAVKLQPYLKQCLSGGSAARIVVIYEMDRLFRASFEGLSKDRTFRFRSNPRRVLVVSLDDDIKATSVSGAVRLFHGRTSRPANVVVLLTAEGLRNSGCNIVEGGSMEQTVRGVVAYARRPPLRDIVRWCHHLIVVFGGTQAVYLSRKPRRGWHGTIHSCPNFDRVAQTNRDLYGAVPARRAITLAAIVKQIDAEMRGRTRRPWDLSDGLRLGLAAYNLHFQEGFKDDENPFRTIEHSLGPSRRHDLRAQLEKDAKKTRGGDFLLSSLVFPVNGTVKTWDRLSDVIPAPKPDGLAPCLRTIVKDGPEVAFRRVGPPFAANASFPGATITCPYLEVGRIKTADPVEIEGFANLFKLFRKYLGDRGWSTPLSIAVFGPPGSGKNFAVKEILRTINPAVKDSPTPTFNLAQFDSVELLTEAFHQVQDRALSSNEVPLVIFDEFDAPFRDALGWLKYFLAPMQDGTFRGKGADYRVGRAIFVFAGGTSSTFEEFAKGGGLKEPERKAAKLTDFISRLKGHLNISDINPPERGGGRGESRRETTLRRIRRAMILRSLLEQHAQLIMHSESDRKTAQIDDQVVDAFMNVPRYRHGVRSMETVIRMSRWIGDQFLPASLPSADQLDMHAPGFLDHLFDRDVEGA